MNRNLLGALGGILLVTLACGLLPQPAPAQPGIETIVAATLQALVPMQSPPVEIPQPTQTVLPGGTPVSFENASLLIPDGLGGGMGERIAAVNADSGAPWEAGPAFIKFTLTAYPLQGTMWSPEIRIYPVEEYRLIDPRVGGKLDEIRSIISNPGGNLPDHLPFLPFVNAGEDFYAQMHVVNFQNGSGIGYLTQFDQAPIPINNQEMFYTYQGLSQDGRFFVSATFPVNAAFLPADGSQNTSTPADGIPVDWNNFENFPTYMTAIAQKISATDPNAFMPPLPALDALIQSIVINP